MAQTGYTPIKIYASATASAAPLAANLDNTNGAELAINITDGKLFYKDNAGVVQVIGTKGGVGTSTNTQVLFNSSGTVAGSANMTFNGTRLTVADFADSSLTSGRVTFAGTGGALSDAAGLTWDGTNLTASQLRSSGLTSGRVTFAGASGLLSDSANLTWNGTTFAITGALTATGNSTFSSTGALTISKGTTGERPTPVSGMLRFNTTTTEFEGYNGTTWASVGGAALSNDTSTSSNVYPLFAAATTGTASTIYTSNAKLLYKPSTGEFQSSELVATNGLFVNATSIAASYTIASGYNAQSVGPVTIASGQSVTITSGQRWLVY